MKVKIEYGYKPEFINFCEAYTTINGETYRKLGKTFEEAKEGLVELLKKIDCIKAPEPEEVEI